MSRRSSSASSSPRNVAISAMTRRFQLYLPDPVMARLELESQVTGRSKADIIRQALEDHFAQGGSSGKALTGIVGILAPNSSSPEGE